MRLLLMLGTHCHDDSRFIHYSLCQNDMEVCFHLAQKCNGEWNMRVIAFQRTGCLKCTRD